MKTLTPKQWVLSIVGVIGIGTGVFGVLGGFRPMIYESMLASTGFGTPTTHEEDAPSTSTDEVVGTSSLSDQGEPVALPVLVPDIQYIEVVESCSSDYSGECVKMRAGPGTSYAEVARLRNGIVLRVSELVTEEGKAWYKVAFVTTLTHPDRVKGDWYVSADFVQPFFSDGDHFLRTGQKYSGSKKIVVDLSEQTLTATEGDLVFMNEKVSTGLRATPTMVGKFRIFRMTPSRYMQGPLPGGGSDQVYDLPGVPWNLYFTDDGAVIHGTYWHEKFGQPWSHGCVNLPTEKAKVLYYWAELGMSVIVVE